MLPVLETLQSYVNMPSGSFDKAEGEKLAQQLKSDFESLGMAVTLYPGQQFAPTVVCKWGQGAHQLMLMGHYDTVFPKDISQPFALVDETKATGSGIVDMKGGIAIMHHALKAALPQIDPQKHAIVCVLNADEEVGSGESREHILDNAKQSFAALSFEPAHEGALTVERKGVTCFELHCSGIGGHAGAAYKKGASAIQELMGKLQQMYTLRDDSKDISVNIGVISGGTADNVIANQAYARGEVRSYDPQEMERLHQALRDICAAPGLTGASTKLIFNASHPPCKQTDQSLALFEQAKAIGTSLGLSPWLLSTGGASDIAFAAQANIPVLDGLGMEGGGVHTTQEWLDITKVEKQLELATRLILELLG